MALNDEDLRNALDLESDIIKAHGLNVCCGCSLRVLTRYPGKPWFLVEACPPRKQRRSSKTYP